MVVPLMDTNYILEVISDSWDRPDSFGQNYKPDQSSVYRAVDNRTPGTASSYGYVTVHSFPTWITDICPNAPNCTWSEVRTLTRTKGASGAAWAPLEV